ncbi:hypothetical protein [Bacillus cereus]|uniref:hypothetical protein n=1 Tax=Bacillus cereus TaxID=1396 RepID=UPI000B4B5D30|nr:hypothetical protein [Bacillus cereus]
MNRVALFAPYHLNDKELETVFDFLYDVIDETKFSILFYRTIDLDIVRFFLELPEEYAKHLEIHLPGTLNSIEDPALKQGIKFLSENGTEIVEHFFTAEALIDNQYNSILKKMIMNVDEVLSFYKSDAKQITKLLRPFTFSKQYKKIGYISYLDKEKDIELVPYTN